jgi:hypothetical protein
MQNIPDHVKSEIYVITNTHPESARKHYVGQTQTHVLNRGKYRPFGSERRLQAHISEARKNGKKESPKLNNAIRKYGADHFRVDVIGICELRFADIFEQLFIEMYDSLKNGYNATIGGNQYRLEADQRQKISRSLTTYYDNEEIKKQHSIVHVEHYDRQKVDKYKHKLIEKVTFGVYANGLVHLLVKTFGSGKRDRITFRGEHVTHESAKTRAVAIATQLVNGDKSKLVVPDRLKDEFVI